MADFKVKNINSQRVAVSSSKGVVEFRMNPGAEIIVSEETAKEFFRSARADISRGKTPIFEVRGPKGNVWDPKKETPWIEPEPAKAPQPKAKPEPKPEPKPEKKPEPKEPKPDTKSDSK